MKRILLSTFITFSLALLSACGAKMTPVQAPTGVQQTLNNTAPLTDAPAIATAEVVSSGAAPMLNEVEYRGKDLYEVHCGQCHKLFDPGQFTEEHWDPILIRMQKQARLTDEQMADIRAYVAVYAE